MVTCVLLLDFMVITFYTPLHHYFKVIICIIVLNLRAEAIKGILNIRQSNSATPGSSSIIQSVQGLSLSSNGESTPGSSTGEKRPHLTAKELEVLKYECINLFI